MPEQRTESHHKAVATLTMRRIAAMAAIQAALGGQDANRTDTGTIHESLREYIDAPQPANGKTFRYRDALSTSAPIASGTEAASELRSYCGECHVNAPLWSGLMDRRQGWRMTPTTARIVIKTPAGTGVQLTYRLEPAAIERGVLGYGVQYLEGADWRPWEVAGKPWKQWLDLAALMLQRKHEHLEQVIHALHVRAVRVPTGTDLSKPPVHGLRAGLRLLCALYVADNWTSRTWRHPPPETLLKTIGLKVLNDHPTAVLTDRTDELNGKEFTSPQTVRRLVDVLCRTDIQVRRLGWTWMTLPPMGTIRPDQAMIFTAHYPIVCRIAMNGRLTDPRPVGVPPQAHPVRWPYPEEDPGSELYQQAANWAAGRTTLSG